MNVRLLVLTAFIALLYGLLGANLYRLQIAKGDYYVKLVENREELLQELKLRRGQIMFTDRNRNTISVALNKDWPVIYAAPKEMKDIKAAAASLASALRVERKKIDELEDNPESRFRLLIEKATEEQIAAVKDLALKGVHVENKQYRFYPFGTLSAQLIGFVGLNEEQETPTGLYGIEKYYNALLARGESISLTIDRNIQAQAEETLAKLTEEFQATGGTVIVQEPSTGKILALANAPPFDPNTYSKFDLATFTNPAVQHMYEPGSVFKPITMAAGIDTHAITPETKFVDTGSITLNSKTIKNWDEKAHGKVTMTEVIEQSINTGAVFAEQKIGHKQFFAYLKKFGFGEKTGLDLPDETAGSLKNLERREARAIDFATASFGQGTAVTPIQLVNAFSSIANGGELMQPYLNAEREPKVIRRVIQKETAYKVTAMMESAVEKARIAAISGYRVAGKTGTAQVPDFNKGGYSEDFIHTYVGFAPASSPKFVALLKLDKPNAPLAGLTVVPAFRELAQFILSYYNVPPDKLENQESGIRN